MVTGVFEESQTVMIHGAVSINAYAICAKVFNSVSITPIPKRTSLYVHTKWRPELASRL